MKRFLQQQWLVLALFGAVALAFVFPEWGASGGRLRSEVTTILGIILVFFLQGWALPTEVLAKGILRWRTHLLIQVFIFILYPLLFILGDLVWSEWIGQPLRIGFFFLAVLPTTITSAIIYTSLADGNTGVALFNTTVANFAAVLITPLWMMTLAQSEVGHMGDLTAVFLKLTRLILLPFIVGQVVHYYFREAPIRHKNLFGHINQGVIIFLVFAAFANSVKADIWGSQGWGMLWITVLLCLVLFFLVNALALLFIRLGLFTREEKPAVFFCSTQKTLATGASFANSLFGADPSLGIILLPVIVFHPIQLILGALLIPWFKKRGQTQNVNIVL